IHSLYMNEKFYQSLSAQEKKWVDEAAARSADDIWKIVTEGEKKAVETITAGGGKVSHPSPEFHKAMQAAGQESWKLFYET
ncbi:MAG: ABC transporter substrate-binding protein, partial [Bilophila sp.]